jgi:stage II sporulation protein M
MLERRIRPYLLILTWIFAAAFLAGTMAPVPVRMEAAKAFQFIVDSYRELEGGKLFFAILLQNVTASILILVSGVLVGIIPVFSIGSNGFFLGVLYRQAAEGTGYSAAALKVLPHGIIEIPALLVAASYGLWLGMTVLRRWRGKESVPLWSHMEHAFRRYFAIVFPLLVIAAAIETALILR